MPEFEPANPEESEDLELEALDDSLDDLDLDEEDYATDAAAIADLFSQLSSAEDSAQPPPIPPAPTPLPVTEASHPKGYLDLPAPVGEVRGSYLSGQPLAGKPDQPASVALPDLSKGGQPPPKPWQRVQYFLASGPVLAVSLVAAIAALTVWLRSEQGVLWRQFSTMASFPASTAELDPQMLKAMDTATLTRRAVEWLQRGNLDLGQQAVAELLNRGSLPQAEMALAAVPRQQAESSSIHFLRGRLAWQAVQQGNPKYRLEDAQVNWETAVRQQPTYPLYYNALGLVYYTQGKLDQADRVWFQALYLLEENQANQQLPASTPELKPKAVLPGFAGKQQIRSGSPNPDILTAYAGLTLVLMQTARQQPAAKQAALLKRAAQLYEKVMVEDPNSFQPRALQQNWMWTRQMIQDWQAAAPQKS